MEPTQIGRYELGKVLGRGALATVYLAKDTKLDRKVALKLLNEDITDEDLRHRFGLEAKSTANLEHPNIVRTFDYSDEDAQRMFLVMEYIAGRSLHDWMHSYGPMSEVTALCIAYRLAEALEHAHSEGMVHRDIKPSNVMLHDGRVVLVDFGGIKVMENLSKLSELISGSQTVALGTPGYMAPEQFEGKNITGASDIFSLGALLYSLTTLKLPYRGGDSEEMYSSARRGKFRDPRDVNPLLTAAFCRLLSECLAVKPTERFPSAVEMKERIGRLLEAHGLTPENIAEELIKYEAGKADFTRLQHERSVQSSLRDLKMALIRVLQENRADPKGRDQVVHLVRQLNQVHLLESDLVSELTEKPHQDYLHQSRKPRRTTWLLVGMALGTGLAMGLLRAMQHYGIWPS